MKVFELFAKIIVDKSKAEQDLNDFSDKAEKASKDVDRSFGKTASLGLATVGKGMVKVGNGLTKYITKPALVAGTAMAGITLKKGWDRMTNIDNAKVKLGSLGNSAKDVKNIMNNALASVKGTAYGLDEAATTAASAVASGVQAGKPLEKYLTNVADLAAVAGTSMGDMGYIMNKVQAGGRATNQELGMLAERGLPVYEWLGKEAGKSADEIFKMASKGQISSEMLQNAIEKNIGGAAKKIGSKTISGAIANFGASLSRVGSNFLGTADDANSFAGKVLPILNGAMDKMGGVEESAKRWGAVAGEVFGAVVQYFKDGKVDTDKLSESGQNLYSKIKPILSIVKLVAKAFGKMSDAGKVHFATAAIATGPLLKATGKVMGKMSDSYKWYKKNEDQIHKMGSATKQYGGKLLNLVKPTNLAAGAQKLFTGALIPLPILIIIGVIATLIGMFVLLWNKSEDFRNFWKETWESIKQAAMEVWEALKPIVDTVMNSIQEIISIVLLTIKDLWHEYGGDIKNFVSEVFGVIETVVMTTMEVIKAIISVAWGIIKTIWNTYGDDIKTFVENTFNGIKTFIDGVMQVIQGVIKVVTSLIKGDWQGAWEGIKQITSGVWTAIKGVIETVTAKIKFVINVVLKAIHTIFGSTWNSIKATTTSIWNGIKNAITTPINAAVNFVRNGINQIKSLFNFKIRWPHIPLPHFRVSGSANPLKWLKGHKPKISIDWYSKAMDKGMIMNQPTVFGINARTGSLMAGGEAGSETVVGTDSLMNMIQRAVNAQNDKVVEVLIAILEQIKSADDNNQSKIEDLINSLKIEWNDRELGRFIKNYAR